MVAKSVKKKPSHKNLSLETRIITTFALIEFFKTDAKNISGNDLQEILDKINQLTQQAYDNDDMQAFDILRKHNLDGISNISELKSKIHRNRVINMYKQLGYFGLSQGTTKEYQMSSIETLATMMYVANVKNADEIAEKLVTKTLTDEEAELLQANISGGLGNLKKCLIKDFERYKYKNQANPIISEIAKDIEEYVFDENKKIQVSYKVKDSKKPFRKKLRENFNTSSKPEFLKLIGTMLTEGKNAAQASSRASNYNQFCQILSNQYPQKDINKLVDNALGISISEADKEKAEQLRIDAYRKKCENLYFKTVAGMLSQKYEYNQTHKIQTDYDVYLKIIDSRYIKDLCDGKNNVYMLAFQDPDYQQQYENMAAEKKLNKEFRDDTAEKQLISVHHNTVTIGSAYDFCSKFFPTFDEEQKMQKCTELANIFGNFTYVIGQDVHQSLEPQGTIEIGATPKSMLMATNIDPQALKNISPALPKYMQEGLKQRFKFNNNDINKRRVYEYMQLPEAKDITFLRQNVIKDKQHVSAMQKFTRYNKEY